MQPANGQTQQQGWEIKGNLGTSMIEPQPIAPAGRLGRLAEMLEELERHASQVFSSAEKVADALCGSRPTPVGKDGSEPFTDGWIDQQLRKAEIVRESLVRAQAQIDRIAGEA